MRIVFNDIEIENFMSFGHVMFDLAQTGAYLVLGENDALADSSNGAGKSALFEALVWCLFGETIRRIPVTQVIRDGTQSCRVKLEFSIGEDRYKLTRSRSRTNATIDFRVVYANGSEASLSQASLRATDEIIKHTLGCSFELFTNSVFYGQGLPYRFIQATDAEKKEILDEILDIGWVADARERAVEITERYEAMLRESDMKIHGLQASMETVRNSISANQGRLDQLQLELEALPDEMATQKRLEELSAQIADLQHNMEDFRSGSATLSDAAVRQRELLRSKESEMSGVGVTLLAHRQKLEGIRNQWNRWVSQGVCPTCLRPLTAEMDVAGFRERNRNEEEAILSELRRLEEQESFLAHQLVVAREATAVAERAYQAHETRMLTDNQTLHSLILEHQTLLARIASSNHSAIQAQYEQLVGMIQNSQGEMGRLQSELSGFEGIRNDTGRALQHLRLWRDAFSSRGLKNLIIQDILPYLNQRATHYEESVSGGEFRIAFRVAGEGGGDRLVVDVTKREDNGVSYLQFSGGERRRADVIVLLSLHDLVLSRLGREISLRVFDEVFENVDAEGIENISSLFNQLGEREAVYVVSHNPALSAQFSNVVTVRKVNGISHLTERIRRNGEEWEVNYQVILREHDLACAKEIARGVDALITGCGLPEAVLGGACSRRNPLPGQD